jgi:hypothetical protein
MLDEPEAGTELDAMPMTPEDLDDLAFRLLEPLPVRNEPLRLFARAAPGNHPCHRFGGFDSPEQMSMSERRTPRLKGAVGWLSQDEMVRAEVDRARGHGVSGLALLEGIDDIVWELETKRTATVASLDGHRLTKRVKLTGRAIEMATPRSHQMLVMELLRVYRWGLLDAVELPTDSSYTLPNGARIVQTERHIVTFGDRVELEAKALGRFSDVIPLRSR